jgi:hypothetical protein
MATKKTTVKKATKRTVRETAPAKKATKRAPKRPAGWTDKVKQNFDDKATGGKKATAKKPAATKGGKKAPAATSSLGREGSVGHKYRECISQGMDKEKTEAAVAKAFPDYEIKPNYFAWYKNDCRKKGIIG